jgi:hypothetical protein
MDHESAVHVTSIALQTANLTAAAYRALARAGLLTTAERDYAVEALQAVARQIEAYPGSE